MVSRAFTTTRHIWTRFTAHRMSLIKRNIYFCTIVLVPCVWHTDIEANKCSSINLCSGAKHCFRANMVCRYNCTNQPCWFSSDYAPREYCCEGKCGSDCSSCTYHRQCLSGEFCCDRGKARVGSCAGSCLGKSCLYDHHCGTGLTCRPYHKKCAHSCIGELCPTPKDCGFNESCCQSNLPGKCAKSCIGKSCKDNQQCGKGEYCCTSVDKCRSNCIGQLCTSHYDCAPSETCCGRHPIAGGICANSCVGRTCKENYHCGRNSYCDGLRKMCLLNCTGQPCSSDGDCARHEICCDRSFNGTGLCAQSCVGKSCTNHSHCGSPEYCRGFNHTKCFSTWTGNSCFSNSECSVQGCRSDDKQRENIWQIAVGVFVPLILILIFLMVFSCCRNTRRTAHRRSAPGEAVQLQTKELQSLQWI